MLHNILQHSSNFAYSGKWSSLNLGSNKCTEDAKYYKIIHFIEHSL